MRRDQVKLNVREVKPGDVFALRMPPVWRSWEVLSIPASRVGAKLVPELMKEVTSFEDLEKLELARIAKAQDREPGVGRPTKRDRRDMEGFIGE